MPGVTRYSFTQNTVVVKNDMSVLNIGSVEKPGIANNVTISRNLFVKDGSPASTAPVMSLHGASTSESVSIRDNAFWNWKPDGDSPLVADPMFERQADEDARLFLPAKSPVRVAGKGNFKEARQQTPRSPDS
jgi:hypothetical protein